MNTHDIGDRVRVTCTFKNLDDVLTSPTTVTAEMLAPGATVPTTPTVTAGSTGVYYVEVDAALAGIYRLRFEGTGALVAAAEHAFSVRRSYF